MKLVYVKSGNNHDLEWHIHLRTWILICSIAGAIYVVSSLIIG